MSINGRYEIASVGFEDAGVSVTYMRMPADIRVGGDLFATHTLNIANNDQYTDAIADIRERVIALLDDALEDFAESLSHDPRDDDEDDERGMGE